VYIRPKVVGPFPKPCARGSYVHRAAFFYSRIFLQNNVSTRHYSSSYLGSVKHIHNINMKVPLKPKDIIVSSMEDL
jgi:hypothetical protein